jgi:uncharacterized membrane protein YagU involved in acid resistance
MAMYAMVVSDWVKYSGFFTPLNHIAASIISPSAMMKSMGAAMHGSNYYFAAGPAIVSWGHFTIEHLIFGMMLGLIYALATSQKSIRSR